MRARRLALVDNDIPNMDEIGTIIDSYNRAVSRKSLWSANGSMKSLYVILCGIASNKGISADNGPCVETIGEGKREKAEQILEYFLMLAKSFRGNEDTENILLKNRQKLSRDEKSQMKKLLRKLLKYLSFEIKMSHRDIRVFDPLVRLMQRNRICTDALDEAINSNVNVFGRSVGSTEPDTELNREAWEK